MSMRKGARAPIRFVVLFVAMAGIPVAVLGWAALQVLEQDIAQEERPGRQGVPPTAPDNFVTVPLPVEG